MSITKNKTWLSLQKLKLNSDRVKLGKEFAWKIIEEIPALRLQELTLAGIILDPKLLNYFKHSSPENVTEILLNNSKVEEEMCKMMGKNVSWTDLHTLNLANNVIGNVGVKYLSKNRSWKEFDSVGSILELY